MSDMKETSEIRLKYEGNMGFVPNHKLDIQVSDTPRTDDRVVYGTLTWNGGIASHWVNAPFARQLERELNAANEQIKRLEEAGDAMFIRSTRVGREIWTKAKEAKP